MFKELERDSESTEHDFPSSLRMEHPKSTSSLWHSTYSTYRVTDRVSFKSDSWHIWSHTGVPIFPLTLVGDGSSSDIRSLDTNISFSYTNIGETGTLIMSFFPTFFPPFSLIFLNYQYWLRISHGWPMVHKKIRQTYIIKHGQEYRFRYSIYSSSNGREKCRRHFWFHVSLIQWMSSNVAVIRRHDLNLRSRVGELMGWWDGEVRLPLANLLFFPTFPVYGSRTLVYPERRVLRTWAVSSHSSVINLYRG